jgi:hypothetical protein
VVLFFKWLPHLIENKLPAAGFQQPEASKKIKTKILICFVSPGLWLLASTFIPYQAGKRPQITVGD